VFPAYTLMMTCKHTSAALPLTGTDPRLCSATQRLDTPPALRRRRYKNGDRGQTYNFSRVFGGDTAQEAFYQATAAPMVRQVTRARHSSVLMAYGISAAGKTHTVEARAPPERGASLCPRLPRAAGHPARGCQVSAWQGRAAVPSRPYRRA
jgi:hypothetical protein